MTCDNLNRSLAEKMLQSLTATHLHRMMASGRTKPGLFGCVNEAGVPSGDYVVKLVGSMDTRVRGPASELLASRLARHFGILGPDPAAVTLHPDLMKWLAINVPEIGVAIGASSGPNFGSRLLTDVSIWPVARPIPDGMLQGAAHVFAFDALISNDDRRRDNPNLLVRGDSIFVIDHESAFSFLYLVASRERDWECRNRRSLQNHVFFYQLRKQPISIALFTQRLADLSDTVLDTMIRELPHQWRHQDLGRISDYIRAARDNAAVFERNVLEVLS
jgi:hypothetical protein